VSAEHPRDCACRGLDGLCPERLRRSELRFRHEQAQARQRELEKRLREAQK
jgi:hypothetical protein